MHHIIEDKEFKIVMKKRIVNIQRFILLSLLFSSCATAYVPNVVNTPLMNNKGEFQASLNTGISGFDPQVAYALTDNIGLMVNGSFANRTSDSSDDFHKHQFVEFGGGYFTKVGSAGRFEVFGGFGAGNLQAEYDNELWVSKARVNSTRFFLQPAIGATTSVFDGSFASRFVYVNLSQNSDNASAMFVEPVLTGKVGYKYVKFIVQTGFSFLLTSNDVAFNYQPFIFSVGVQLNLGKLFDE